MTARRKLTKEELQAATAFARALDASTYILETLAPALGVTPGAVGHWYRGEVTIPLRRAAQVSSLLEVSPGDICHEWQTSVAPYMNSQALPARETRLLECFRLASEADKVSLERVATAMTSTPGTTRFSKTG